MQTFIAAVSSALIISFMCSVFESVVLSINTAQVEALAKTGARSGRLMRQFKERIDVPIAAILIVNTIAHTIGAAVAGASYQNVFDPGTLWIFLNSSTNGPVGATQKKHLTGWSDLLKIPCGIPRGMTIRSPAVATLSSPPSIRSKRPSSM